jgi:hypothetical protein
MFSFFKWHKPSRSSAFSTFIRTASAGEKKRVYRVVLEKATERQNRLASKTASAER